jgi:hypothetical protein
MRACLDSRQQRLRLSDLGHLVGRRETFERGFENSVRLGGAAGRLVALGKRERAARRPKLRAPCSRAT